MSRLALQVAAALRSGAGRYRRYHRKREVPVSLEAEDVQGLIVRGYGNLPHCQYVLLQIRDAQEARGWIAGRLAMVGRGSPSPSERALTLAFTASGLSALGLPPPVMAGFSAEFLAGASGDHRSRFLGDVGPSAPSEWRWGGPSAPAVHVLLALFAKTEQGLSELLESERAAWTRNRLVVVHEQPTVSLGGKEHFGFADGISQPAIEGYHQVDSELHRVRAGEFVLGYRNEYDLYTGRPLVDEGFPGADVLPRDVEGSGRADLGRNGTYLVVRQLQQDVVAFRAALDQVTQRPDGSSDSQAAARLGAKMVGRWASGAPLMTSPWEDDPTRAKDNEFRYHKADLDGLLCPIGSHIRRSNPRDSLAPEPGSEESLAINRRHRLVRRGRPYGPPLPAGAVDRVDRGLMFVAVNANIGRQFEFVQHTWLMNTRFNGLSGESDPLMSGDESNVFSIPQNPLRQCMAGMGGFVKTVGAAYLFMPGLRGLRFLTSLPEGTRGA